MSQLELITFINEEVFAISLRYSSGISESWMFLCLLWWAIFLTRLYISLKRIESGYWFSQPLWGWRRSCDMKRHRRWPCRLAILSSAFATMMDYQVYPRPQVKENRVSLMIVC